METTTRRTSRMFDGLNRNAGIAALSGGYVVRDIYRPYWVNIA
ncbi:hypothetical protein [Pseudaquidulcibacter saccharophilus]|nr:hypothetical protein [Pseudaquidulcibacter saccharophilus]